MTRERRSATARSVLLSALAFATLVAGCATTTVDENGDTIDGVSTTTTVAPTETSRIGEVEGTPAALFGEIVTDMTVLSDEIVDDGDEDATIARIEATWDAVRPEVESATPQLVDNLQAAIDMARTAVDKKRPADADKALGLLIDSIAAYNGGS